MKSRETIDDDTKNNLVRMIEVSSVLILFWLQFLNWQIQEMILSPV